MQSERASGNLPFIFGVLEAFLQRYTSILQSLNKAGKDGEI